METGHLESASAGGASFLPGPEGGDLMSSSAGCPAGGQQRLSEVELLAAAEMGGAAAVAAVTAGSCVWRISSWARSVSSYRARYGARLWTSIRSNRS